MELHHDITYTTLEQLIIPQNMHINLIKVNCLYFELVNIIQDSDKEIIKRNTYSHPCTHIHEVSKDMRPPPSHLLPTYVNH